MPSARQPGLRSYLDAPAMCLSFISGRRCVCMLPRTDGRKGVLPGGLVMANVSCGFDPRGAPGGHYCWPGRLSRLVPSGLIRRAGLPGR
jgi:hypothetical protein